MSQPPQTRSSRSASFTKSLIFGERASVRFPRRIVPICVSDPTGTAFFVRTSSTPAMKVVATAPMPGNSTPSFPFGAAILAGFFMNLLGLSIGEQQRVEQLRADTVPQTHYSGGSLDQMQTESGNFTPVARGKSRSGTLIRGLGRARHFQGSEFAARYRRRHRGRLLERQAHTFSRNRINASGGISDERHVPYGDSPQRMHQGDRTALAAALPRAADPFGQFRHAGQRPLEVRVLGLSCNHDDANLFARDWCDVGLGTFAPVDFHAVGPGPHTIVAPRGVALCATAVGFQPAPLPDSGPGSIGSQNPARGHNPSGNAHSFSRNPAHRRVPEQSYPGLFCFLRQQFVQEGAPDANSQTFREVRRRAQIALDKLNSAKLLPNASR